MVVLKGVAARLARRRPQRLEIEKRKRPADRSAGTTVQRDHAMQSVHLNEAAAADAGQQTFNCDATSSVAAAIEAAAPASSTGLSAPAAAPPAVFFAAKLPCMVTLPIARGSSHSEDETSLSSAKFGRQDRSDASRSSLEHQSVGTTGSNADAPAAAPLVYLAAKLPPEAKLKGGSSVHLDFGEPDEVRQQRLEAAARAIEKEALVKKLRSIIVANNQVQECPTQ